MGTNLKNIIKKTISKRLSNHIIALNDEICIALLVHHAYDMEFKFKVTSIKPADTCIINKNTKFSVPKGLLEPIQNSIYKIDQFLPEAFKNLNSKEFKKILNDDKKFEEIFAGSIAIPEEIQDPRIYYKQNLGALFTNAIEYSRNGDYQNAVESIKNAVKIYPDFYTAWYNLASFYYEIEKFEEAIEAIENCIEIIENPLKRKWLNFPFDNINLEKMKKIFNKSIDLKKEIIHKIKEK